MKDLKSQKDLLKERLEKRRKLRGLGRLNRSMMGFAGEKSNDQSFNLNSSVIQKNDTSLSIGGADNSEEFNEIFAVIDSIEDKKDISKIDETDEEHKTQNSESKKEHSE